MSFTKWVLFQVIGYNFVLLSQQQQQQDGDDQDDDDCAFISGQHCDQNGICKYCAMCLQSSCILSKTINTNNGTSTTCNTAQFGTMNVYNWYDYCLSSENDLAGSYCATSTECYQYRKSAGPSVTYAWHNLTCNPNTCMLMAGDGAPPPAPMPLPTSNEADTTRSRKDNTNHHENHHYYHDRSPLHNPAAIALTVICCLVLLAGLYWFIRFGKKKGWFFSKTSSGHSIASVPSTAPPSFSSIPPEMRQTLRSSSSFQGDSLPPYLSPYSYPPKYEQAIVTQIRGLREESSSSSSSDHHMPSMWVPVYFTNQQGRRDPELFGFTPNSYWIPSFQQNPFQDQSPPPAS